MPSARTSPASLLPTENKPINQSVLALCPVIAPHVHPSQALITKWRRGARAPDQQLATLSSGAAQKVQSSSFSNTRGKMKWKCEICRSCKGLVLKLQYVHPRRLASALWWYAEVFQKKKWTLTIKKKTTCILIFFLGPCQIMTWSPISLFILQNSDEKQFYRVRFKWVTHRFKSAFWVTESVIDSVQKCICTHKISTRSQLKWIKMGQWSMSLWKKKQKFSKGKHLLFSVQLKCIMRSSDLEHSNNFHSHVSPAHY